MKKILFFAMALVAGAMTFTSCEKDKIDSPLVGTWEQVEKYYDEVGKVTHRMEAIITFDGKGNYALEEAKYFDWDEGGTEVHGKGIERGSFSIEGDIVTVHHEESISNYNPETGKMEELDAEYLRHYDEQLRFTIDGKKLTLIRNLNGTSPYRGQDSWEEVYTKK